MYLGIDIGGTKTLIALFSARGHILHRHKFPTPKSSKLFLRDLAKNLQLFKKYNPKSIIVAIPGIIKANDQFIFGNRNWPDLDLRSTIKNVFNVPIYFENDANLGALYESKNHPEKVIYLTFSTGIGGGICEKSRLVPCSKSFEPGHKKYLFNGKEQEWENIAAASAIIKHYHVDTVTKLKHAETSHEIASRLSHGLEEITKEYLPDTIIIGGPLALIYHQYKKYLPKVNSVKYCRAKRPTESTIYGCYIFAKTQD